MERKLQQKHEAAGHAGSTVKVQPKMNGRAHVVSLLPFLLSPGLQHMKLYQLY